MPMIVLYPISSSHAKSKQSLLLSAQTLKAPQAQNTSKDQAKHAASRPECCWHILAVPTRWSFLSWSAAICCNQTFWSCSLNFNRRIVNTGLGWALILKSTYLYSCQTLISRVVGSGSADEGNSSLKEKAPVASSKFKANNGKTIEQLVTPN